ncbi:MAG TPA: AraC family transcriptional regulator [Polyangiales bacterium]|nr:AraC family transcriptional regulator [Polyangiales bacterium]
MSTDVLSEVLRAVRLTGALFFSIEGSAPWVAEAPEARRVAQQVMPGCEHVVEYHLVVQGECWAGLIGEPGAHLLAGDLVVFPQGDAHVIASDPGMRSPPQLEFYRHPSCGQLPVTVSFNGPGTETERAQIVCGFLGCDARPFNPLLATLPPMIHVPRRPAPAGAWIEQLVQLAVLETSARHSGGEAMLARLSELLFIEVVRHHLATLSPETTGWLAGQRDEHIGKSLSALHDRPAQPWTLEELAREVGLSRSMLAERFHHYVGVPPMHYLARWRMQLAASLLSGSTLNLVEVAERVGYNSEAGLSRAFKRMVGVAPSAWREGARPDAAFSAPELSVSEA